MNKQWGLAFFLVLLFPIFYIWIWINWNLLFEKFQLKMSSLKEIGNQIIFVREFDIFVFSVKKLFFFWKRFLDFYFYLFFLKKKQICYTLEFWNNKLNDFYSWFRTMDRVCGALSHSLSFRALTLLLRAFNYSTKSDYGLLCD